MNIPIQYRPKYIEGYESEYGVCRAGYVYSFKKWRFLAGSTNKYGYKKIGLYKNNKPKTFLIHRLVAEAFIPNPNNLPQVNHKDEVKYHNWVENLEWCTLKYNVNYGTARERIIKKQKGKPGKRGKEHPRSKPVLMFTLDGEFIRRFDSVGEANVYLGKPRKSTNIIMSIRGHNGQKTAWNYKWEFE